jgi:hypothetical protein
LTFALGGTLTNLIVIYVLLPLPDRAKRGKPWPAYEERSCANDHNRLMCNKWQQRPEKLQLRIAALNSRQVTIYFLFARSLPAAIIPVI